MIPYYYNPKDDRVGFVFPFLVGAVTGGAAIGLTRPRPIVNANPSPYPPYGYSSYYYQSYPPYPYFR